MCQCCIAREPQRTHLGHKENPGMRIKSDFWSYSFTPGNLADSVILRQIRVKKKSIYHTGSNYHLHENVNYIDYQSLVKQSKSITEPDSHPLNAGCCLRVECVCLYRPLTVNLYNSVSWLVSNHLKLLRMCFLELQITKIWNSLKLIK